MRRPSRGWASGVDPMSSGFGVPGYGIRGHSGSGNSHYSTNDGWARGQSSSGREGSRGFCATGSDNFGRSGSGSGSANVNSYSSDHSNYHCWTQAQDWWVWNAWWGAYGPINGNAPCFCQQCADKSGFTGHRSQSSPYNPDEFVTWARSFGHGPPNAARYCDSCWDKTQNGRSIPGGWRTPCYNADWFETLNSLPRRSYSTFDRSGSSFRSDRYGSSQGGFNTRSSRPGVFSSRSRDSSSYFGDGTDTPRQRADRGSYNNHSSRNEYIGSRCERSSTFAGTAARANSRSPGAVKPLSEAAAAWWQEIQPLIAGKHAQLRESGFPDKPSGHAVEALVKQFPNYPAVLKKLRIAFHPDRFSAVPSDKVDSYKERATAIYQVIQNKYEEHFK